MKKSVFLIIAVLAMFAAGCGSDEPDNPKDVKVVSASANYYLSVTPDVMKFMNITIHYMKSNDPKDLVTVEMYAPNTEIAPPTVTNEVRPSVPARFGIKGEIKPIEDVSYDQEANYTLGFTARATIKGYDKDGNEVALDGANEDTHKEQIVKGTEVKALIDQLLLMSNLFNRSWFVYADGSLKPGLL